MKKSIRGLYLLLILTNCISRSNPKPPNSATTTKNKDLPEQAVPVKKDTVATEDISSEVKAKKSLELMEINLKTDTLEIVSSSSFFYYPFGKFHTIADFIQGGNSLNTYEETQKVVDSTDNTILYKFTNKDNYLKVLNSSDTKAIEIVGCNISDLNLQLSNKIKLGMTKKDFLDVFFDDVPYSKFQGVTVVKFVSGLMGIWHYYYFKENKLAFYKMNTDYIYK